MLCELETDKVSVEVPSPVTGVLAEIIAPEGTTVSASARLAVVTEGAAGAVAAPAPAAKAEAPAAAASAKDVENAPSAKKAMAEAGLTPAPGAGHRPRWPHHERRRRPRRRTSAPLAAEPAPPRHSAARPSQ